MKIEKISDTQVKFILTQDDLTDKNIKLEDLAVSNDKTKELFQDILSKALDECGFDIDDAPLMVEALPVALDSIMIIVTKLNTEDMQSKDSSSAPIISKALNGMPVLIFLNVMLRLTLLLANITGISFI